VIEELEEELEGSPTHIPQRMVLNVVSKVLNSRLINSLTKRICSTEY